MVNRINSSQEMFGKMMEKVQEMFSISQYMTKKNSLKQQRSYLEKPKKDLKKPDNLKKQKEDKLI